jgi:hypothetical protein
VRPTRLVLFLIPALAVVAAGLPRPALAEGACRAEGSATITTKLVCPNQPFELRFSLRLTCVEGASASCIQAVRLVDLLPAGIAPWQGEDGAAEPDAAGDWSLEFTEGLGGALETSRKVVALQPGAFSLGGAEITVVDDEGLTSSTHLEPALLTVVPECPRSSTAPLFLPIVYRPSCLPAPGPLDLVLAIDRSASVGDGLDEITRGAASLLDALNLAKEGTGGRILQSEQRHDRAAIVAFDGRAEVVAPLGSTRTALVAALTSLQPRHGTRFEHALDTAGEILGPASPSRRRLVVLVTDGVAIGGGGAEAARLAAVRLRAAGVRILALGLGPAPNWPLLRALAEPNAPVAAASQAAALPGAFRTIAAAARCTRATDL